MTQSLTRHLESHHGRRRSESRIVAAGLPWKTALTQTTCSKAKPIVDTQVSQNVLSRRQQQLSVPSNVQWARFSRPAAKRHIRHVLSEPSAIHHENAEERLGIAYRNRGPSFKGTVSFQHHNFVQREKWRVFPVDQKQPLWLASKDMSSAGNSNVAEIIMR